jgi:hypothetical protein
VDSVQVHFCSDGMAEASGTVKLLGLRTKVVARGTLDPSGTRPRIRISSIRAGNLPSAVARPVVERILDSSGVLMPSFKEHLTAVQIDDGSATISGGP